VHAEKRQHAVNGQAHARCPPVTEHPMRAFSPCLGSRSVKKRRRNQVRLLAWKGALMCRTRFPPSGEIAAEDICVILPRGRRPSQIGNYCHSNNYPQIGPDCLTKRGEYRSKRRRGQELSSPSEDQPISAATSLAFQASSLINVPGHPRRTRGERIDSPALRRASAMRLCGRISWEPRPASTRDGIGGTG
jgi:hypothetical protein